MTDTIVKATVAIAADPEHEALYSCCLAVLEVTRAHQKTRTRAQTQIICFES